MNKIFNNNMNSLSTWLTFLEKLDPHKIKLGLERIAPIAQKLQITSFNFPVITVTGTNGKGSCVAILEAIFKAAGYRVGAYTSPHLFHFNERIRIDGQQIDDENLCIAFNSIKQISDQLKINLTYFEFTTLAALKFFREANLDVLILEVGLGGRLDAVNIVNADIAVITTVDIDHVKWLGPDRESIGREKAGIFRADASAVCGDFAPPQSVLTTAAELNVRLYCIDRDFSFQNFADKWNWQSKKNLWLDLPLPRFELQNVATALMVIELLNDRLPVTLTKIKKGLLSAFLPGRFQTINNTIFDVAHNPHAAHWLAKRLEGIPRQRLFAVVGMLADKDIPGTLAPLCSQITAWYVGGLSGPRGASSDILFDALRAIGIKRCYNFASVKEAFNNALQACEKDDRIVVFGSFYTVADCLQMVKAYS